MRWPLVPVTITALSLFAALACAQGRRPAQVLPGIDVLLADSARLIAGRRLGLITNQTGVDARGTSSIDRLFAAGNRCRAATECPALVALFAPEHGLRGGAAPGAHVDDDTDSATGLPIYSLYGANRAPTADQLGEIDVLLIDLQDVGARTYTYVSTTVLALRAARAAGKRVLVLDRPNPIGCAVEGPVLDTAFASFIGLLPVPLRHGMTIGELARFANAELHIGADLVVVPVKGWRRCQWFDETGLPWVRPSPNLPDLESVAWYPGTVLFEATNLSVGRGSDAPFRQIGAPWLADSSFARLKARLGEPVSFTPRAPGDGKFDGVALGGIRFPHFDRRRTEPVRYALQVLAELQGAPGSDVRIDALGMARRLGVPLSFYQPGPAGRESPDVAAFRRKAAPYLLYP